MSCRARGSKGSKRENAYNWKGDSVRYNALHRWVQRNFGNPPFCENCGKKGIKNKKRWIIEWANITGEYGRDKSQWKGLCKKCHCEEDKNYRNNKNKKTFVDPKTKQVEFKDSVKPIVGVV
jgi:hypothetical protein